MTTDGASGVKAWMARGNERWAAHDHEGALAAYEQAVLLEPGSAAAICARGAAWCEIGERGLALVDLDRAVELDATLLSARFWRAHVRRQLGDGEGAIEDLDEAIRLEPENPAGRWKRGRARERRGDLAGALEDLDAAVRGLPGNANLLADRGRVLAGLGREDEALEALGEAIGLEPELEHARDLRASLLIERGEYDRAVEDLAALDAVDPDGDVEGESMTTPKRTLIAGLLREHFAPRSIDDLTITERVFPLRARPDLQRAVDRIFAEGVEVDHFSGVLDRHGFEGLELANLIVPNPHEPAKTAPPQYEEVDVGDEEPVRCLKNGLWLLRAGELRFAVLLGPAGRHGMVSGVQFQVAASNDAEGARWTRDLVRRLGDAVLESPSYRGKILSLECRSRYFGDAPGITVHRLRTVGREEVILPRATLDLLDRNILAFARGRSRLAELGLATKKGILLYGPPGTGKTHTIHYLVGALEGTTTLLITAEQIGVFGEYMTLARLLQPSLVVIEDVDLIARDRESSSPGVQVLLHGLLNEMDGLRADADVLFVLTTNRPETLEAALASRPGRIDQAIEFPLPDEDGRAKLIRLYSYDLRVGEALVDEIVRRTANVSAAFIKELMRRCAQFVVERGGDAEVTVEDVKEALDELLFTGGSLNRKLLGVHLDG